MTMKMLMVMMMRTKMMIMRFVVLMVIFAVTNRCSQLANKHINLDLQRAIDTKGHLTLVSC